MYKVLLLLPLLLGGCASVTAIVAPPFVPVPIHVYDQAQYFLDVSECQAAGADWKPLFSFGSALTRTVDGATSNTSLIPISPLVPVYGAVGGALGAASDGLDVMSAQHSAVARHCLTDMLAIDHAAIIARPEN